MARPLRIEFPGAVYHVTSRGNERKTIFRDDQDRKMFLDTLADVTLRYNWLCHAYRLWGQVLQSYISKNKRGVIHQNKDGEIEKNFKFELAD
jgi:hypothetical protein